MSSNIFAYELTSGISATSNWKLKPASKQRSWMSTNNNHAYRCLPMVMANQNGWIVENPIGFTAVWDGTIETKAAPESIQFSFDEAIPEHSPNAGVVSDFGNGIITFHIPYLFRTPEEISLVVRGPCNQWKAHAAALDGLVETDWLPFTFTMNWKIITPNQPVRFEQGEPICMFYPLAAQQIETYEAIIEPLENNPELLEAYKTWQFMRYVARHTKDDELTFLDSRYARGKDYQGQTSETHQRSLAVPPFRTSDA